MMERRPGPTAIWICGSRDPAPEEVAAEIAEERRRKVTRVYLGGFVKSTGRNDHVPVTLPTDNVLRLAWRGRRDFVVPSLKKTLRELAVNCPIVDATVKNIADLDALSDAEIDRLILDRVENGDTFGAVKLLREKRGYTLTTPRRSSTDSPCGCKLA